MTASERDGAVQILEEQVSPRYSSGFRWIGLFASTSGTLTATFVTSGLGVVTGVILSRSLGPDGRGDLAAAMLWTSIFVLVGDLGVGFAVAVIAAREPFRRADLWGWTLLLGLCLGSILAILGLQIVSLTTISQQGFAILEITAWAAPCTLAMGFQAYLVLGGGRTAEYNLIKLGTAVLYALMLSVLWNLDARSAHGYAIAFVISQAVGAAGATWATGRMLGWRIRLELEAGKTLFKAGFNNYCASLAAQTTLKLDQLILSISAPPRDLGLYAVAIAMSMSFGPLYGGLATKVLGETAAASSIEVARRVCRRYVFIGAGVGGLGAGLLALIAPNVIVLLFGHDFLPAASATRILLCASVLQGVNVILGNSLRGMQRPGAAAVGESIGMIITVSILPFLLTNFGIGGAALSSLLASAGVAAYQSLIALRTPVGQSNIPESTKPLAGSSAGQR